MSRRTLAAIPLLMALLLVRFGITNALFGDSASAGSNTFTAGTVDVSTTPSSAVTTFSDMAPGDRTTQLLTVENNGSLQLRYSISGSATDPDSKGLKNQLVLAIRFRDATTPNVPCDNFDGTLLYTGDLDGTTGTLIGNPAQGAQSGDRTIAAGATERLCYRVELPSSSGNGYEDATTTATFTFDAEQTANN
jgi:spore coat-associated protein N